MSERMYADMAEHVIDEIGKVYITSQERLDDILYVEEVLDGATARLATAEAALREIDEKVNYSKCNWNAGTLFSLANAVQSIARRVLQDMEKK